MLKLLNKIQFEKSKNKMNHIADTQVAVEYYKKKNNNLDFLLRKRFDWMNDFINLSDFGLEVGSGVGFSKDYIEVCKTSSKTKTELVNLCKENGGAWYWCQKTDKNGDPVGRQFNNPKSDSESKTILTEKITPEV